MARVRPSGPESQDSRVYSDTEYIVANGVTDFIFWVLTVLHEGSELYCRNNISAVYTPSERSARIKDPVQVAKTRSEDCFAQNPTPFPTTGSLPVRWVFLLLQNSISPRKSWKPRGYSRNRLNLGVPSFDGSFASSKLGRRRGTERPALTLARRPEQNIRLRPWPGDSFVPLGVLLDSREDSKPNVVLAANRNYHGILRIKHRFQLGANIST